MTRDSSFRIETHRDGDRLLVAVRGRVDVQCAQRFLEDVTRSARDAQGDLTLDLSGVDYFDSGGSAALLGLRQRLAADGRSVQVRAATPEIEGLMRLIDFEALAQPLSFSEVAAASGPERIGRATLAVLADARELVAFIGEVILGLRDVVRHPAQVRWNDTWSYMHRTGVSALPIVSLISFLMGLITAFQAAVQLRQFGADIYIADLVGLSITRELGPLMTAIIASGRSGAAFAAEIGTMKVSEEVDALTTMGLDRTRFLVTPKVLALLMMLPCLTLYSDLVGILGGLTVASGGFDIPMIVYMRETAYAVSTWDVFSGLVKSVAFALLIAGVGCLRGFQARTGAESVGRITTSAIVAGIFLIIVADAVFTVLFHYWI